MKEEHKVKYIHYYANKPYACSKQDFSLMQSIRMQYELYEGLQGPERTEAVALMSQLCHR